MHVAYVVGWRRTEENQYLSVPVGVGAQLPRRAQELLGWAAHDAIAAGGGYLGTVDLRDPVELLAEGALCSWGCFRPPSRESFQRTL